MAEKPQIRNFCIIAHIDHGKSTLADRFLEITHTVKKSKQDQQLDTMELERERGITIKLKAIRMNYEVDGRAFQLNLIDTPGHVDFGYEVSRSLAACEGALLLIDATQGVQAQTLVNYEKAKAEGLKIIPVINKVDLPSAQVENSALAFIELGFREDEIQYISAKTGKGVRTLLNSIVEKVPPPKMSSAEKTPAALVFDSFYDDYRGVVAFVRVYNGRLTGNQKIKFVKSGATSKIVELGYLSPLEVKAESLNFGEVGFVATGLKAIEQVRVGDTLTAVDADVPAIAGYREPTPVLFLSFYPQDASDYLDLREAVERLSLNDAAFTFEPESIGSMGKGFRAGFLGMLHADIITERIQREFEIPLFITSPTVKYELTTTSNQILEIKSASEFPDPTRIKEVKEPWVHLEIFTVPSYLSAIMDLCKTRRARYVATETWEGQRLKIIYEMPLVELIIDFYDKLKSVSSGYASLDYELIEYRPTKVVKLDVLVAGEPVHPLSQLIQSHDLQGEAKRVVEKLKELIPRQQFKVSLQASVNGKVIAREDLAAVRKDVTGHLYGGDVTRKKKLLEQQKKGKKRLQKFGAVELPSDVFWSVLKR